MYVEAYEMSNESFYNKRCLVTFKFFKDYQLLSLLFGRVDDGRRQLFSEKSHESKLLVTPSTFDLDFELFSSLSLLLTFIDISVFNRLNNVAAKNLSWR